MIYGDGLQSRDFTYVANVVDANLRALKAKGLPGQVGQRGDGQADHAQAAARRPRAGDRRARRRRSYGPARPGDVRHSLADIRLARKLLGYRPTVDLATGLRRTVEWYRSTHA